MNAESKAMHARIEALAPVDQLAVGLELIRRGDLLNLHLGVAIARLAVARIDALLPPVERVIAAAMAPTAVLAPCPDGVH